MNKIGDTIESFLDSRRAKRLSARTVDWYAQQLRVYVAYAKSNSLDAYDPDTVETFLLSQQNLDLSESTIHARFSALRAFMRWHTKRKKRKRENFDNPMDYVDAPQVSKRKPRVANPEHLKKLILSIGSATFADIRDKFCIRLLWSTGLRVDEACHLELGDVDLVEGFVMVRSGKGSKDRLCPFDEIFRTSYLEYLINRPKTDCKSLLLTVGGKNSYFTTGLLPNGVRQMLRRRCADAVIPLVNPHSVRHLYAIERLNNGMSLSAVSAAMGHTSVSFTASNYAKWQTSGLRREYDNASSRQST